MMKTLTTLFLIVLCGFQVNAQESDDVRKSLKVKLKDSKDLVVYIDGKKYDSDIVDLLDTDKIESVTVFKGEEARKRYDAPNGVIVIVTKKSGDKLEAKPDTDYPLVILDGKESNREAIADLDPNQIESIEVVKGDKAMSKYKAKNGVIIIKTKKKK